MRYAGVYRVSFGDTAEPEHMRNFGLAVLLEGGHVFGGDAGFLYTGTYGVEGGLLKAHLKIMQHDGRVGDAFASGDGVFDINIGATPTHERTFSGKMGRPGSDALLHLVAERIAEL